MRLISYFDDKMRRRLAAARDGGYVDLTAVNPEFQGHISMLLPLPDGLERVAKAIPSGRPIEKSMIHFAPPISNPNKIICIGLNYADHARETKKEPTPEPVVFNKFAAAVNAHEQPIVLPSVSAEVDYEAELVAVIGRPGRNIARKDALSHVVGYCCGNDVSARDWQRKPGGQWLLGKSFTTFAPFGPELVTADEVGDPHNLRIQLRLNGETMQDSHTSQLIFSIDELISYISKVTTLIPGDLIFTGTPAGVGVARDPKVFLKPGDVVEVEIEKLGVLRNPVVASES